MTDVPLAKAAAAETPRVDPPESSGSLGPALEPSSGPPVRGEPGVDEREVTLDPGGLGSITGSALDPTLGCSPKGRRWRAPADWKDHLSARSPEGILDRIVDGDPLGLRRLVGEVIRKERRLADPDRVQLRAIACIAHRATSGASPDSPRWVEDRVREALAGVLAAERQRLGAVEPPGPKEAWSVLAGPLGLDPAGLQRACSALNHCASEDREAFFALVIDGLDLEEASACAGVTAVEFAKRARRAIHVALDAAFNNGSNSASNSGPDGGPDGGDVASEVASEVALGAVLDPTPDSMSGTGAPTSGTDGSEVLG